jgi:DNA modification methylase
MSSDSDEVRPSLQLGDAREADCFLSEQAQRRHPDRPDDPFLTVTITSPPYANLINYGVANQIGYGQTWGEYLTDCQKLFSVLYRWTRDDGSLWIVADTFMDEVRKPQSAADLPTPSSVKMLPFELAKIAELAGWTLREVVIWHKVRTLPWSRRGHLRNAFEYVLFMVRSDSYQYHDDRLRNQSDLGRWWVRYPERYHPFGIAPDNVWSIPIPIQGAWGSPTVRHACPFPPELVRRILLLSSEPGEIIFDPFAGSGTVLAVAEAMRRQSFGIELNQDYVNAFYQIVRPEITQRWQDDTADTSSSDTANTILELRVVKFPKLLLRKLKDTRLGSVIPTLGAAIIDTPPSEYFSEDPISVRFIFVLPDVTADLRKEVQEVLAELCLRPPLSKFGFSGAIYVIEGHEFVQLVGDRNLYLYEHGYTWMSSGNVTPEQALTVPFSKKPGKHSPVVANVEIKLRIPEHD